MTLAPAPISSETLDALAQLVESRGGLRFADGRRSELSAKAALIFADSGFPTWDAYLAHLFSPGGGALLEQLLENLSIGETYFCRHRSYFETLEHSILPELIARRRVTRRLRLWSAGCATGEESYSLAILVHRLLPDLADWQVSILGTDLNRTFLARAEAGLYRDWSFRETDEDFRSANFTREGVNYRIRAELQRLVRFAYLNLAQGGYPSTAHGTAGCDLILCRNVLIYFAPDVAGQVVARLRMALAPDGWLVLGPSDPLPGLLAGFAMHNTSGGIFYQRVEDDSLAHVAPIAGAWAPQDLGNPPRADRLGDATPGLSPEPTAPEPTGDPLAAQRNSRTLPTATPRVDPPAHETDWREACLQARAAANQSHFDEAEAHCQQAIARARLHPEPYYLLGTFREAAGDASAARSAFRQALYVDRAFAPAHLALAAIHRRVGNLGQARQALLRAQQLLLGRAADELILADEGLTVGRLRDAVAQALSGPSRGGPR